MGTEHYLNDAPDNEFSTRTVDKRRSFDSDDAMATRVPEAIHTQSNIPEPFNLNKEIADALVEPVGMRLLVAEDRFEYHGRIVIPDKLKKAPTTGYIVAISADLLPEQRARYHTGDKVLYGIYSGTAVQFKNRPRYRIIAIEEVLGLVRTEEELKDVGA